MSRSWTNQPIDVARRFGLGLWAKLRNVFDVSLSNRLVLIVVPMVLLAGCLAAAIIGAQQFDEAQDARQDQARLLGRSYAALLRDYIVNMDTSQLAPVLRIAASTAPVVCASLAGKSLPLRYGWPASDCATDGEGGPLIAIPLQAEQQEIAVLTLRLQESYLGASLWRSALPGIAAILATLAALAVVLSIVLRRQVVRPIRDLTEAMRLLSRGRTDFVLPRPGGRDEIAEMAETLIVFRNTKIEADRVAGELREAQGELIESAKLAFLGSMVAGVAHEVNTPLGICVTSVATARDLLAEIERRLVTRQLTEAELLSFFTKLKQSDTLVLANLERAATLIRSFKGIAADQASETPRRIEIGAYLREIAASLQPELKRTRIDLRVEVEHEIHATVPPGTLWQIFSNLVLNGVIHAFEPGASGSITLRAAMQSGDRVRLSYHDDGKGMTPEVRAHIFEPFFTTRRGQGGTGLGLFITYQLVTQTLGGRIQCHSQLGHGAHFDIVFPATPPSSEA